MNTYSVYDSTTGLFTGLKLSGDDGYIQANLAQGQSVLQGEYDPKRQKVDLATLTAVPWQPPRPADSHRCTWEWSVESFEWVPVPTDPVLADLARRARDQKLAATDWIVAKHMELGTPIPQEYSTYRQALRDITLQPGFPRNVVWPAPPA